MLSVAMIGKNEAETIYKALNSVRPYASEVIFVDTGSSDETPAIAKNCGAIVYDFAWSDDFAKARNFAIGKCKGDWILSIDCDEYLFATKNTTDFLAKIYALDAEIGYEVQIINKLPDEKEGIHTSIRLFRNIPSIRFNNPIHESVSSAIFRLDPHKNLSRADFQIYHDGYRSASANKKKLDRNLRILSNWVNDSPRNPYAWFKLGLTMKFVSHEKSTACLLHAYQLIIEHKDSDTFPFTSELLQHLVPAAQRLDPLLAEAIRSSTKRILGANQKSI